MSVRWHSLLKARLVLAAVVAALPMARPTACAQNVNGSLAVSATILPPAPRQETRLTAFDVGRDGVAQLETTAFIAAPVSRIVMWSVSSSANGFVPITQPPMRIMGASHRASEAPTSPRDTRGRETEETRELRLRFGVDLGRTASAPSDSSTRDVTVRIHYLIVPGT